MSNVNANAKPVIKSPEDLFLDAEAATLDFERARLCEPEVAEARGARSGRAKATAEFRRRVEAVRAERLRLAAARATDAAARAPDVTATKPNAPVR